MSDTTMHASDHIPAVDHVEGQLIMPFYIICDVSGSMYGDMKDLNAALNQLRSDIMSDPVVNDLTMLSVITFQSSAQTVVPLGAPSEINLPALSAGGGTNYGAAFREYHRAFEADRARLKAEGKKVYRPCVFFLSDGAPGDRDYLQTFRSLLAYDPQAKTGNKAFPYVVTFGFRDAPQEVMQQLAYPDFGGTRGRWFVSRSSNVGELLKSMTAAIGNTVISSGQSASTGNAMIVKPAMEDSSNTQFGEAGDHV
ncbi:VWA domain-containing protein [Actinoplanes sp. NPDC051411]|uniref:vWA domain-containing protein n=1 Tax=Actinoplanes sp. NPDC051411 TaxID=3155522 RepID=UPI003431954C